MENLTGQFYSYQYLRRFRAVLILLFGLVFSFSQATASAMRKVLFVPLDNRPPCLQFVQLLARESQIQLVVPPSQWLGIFKVYGQSDSIAHWLATANFSDTQAAIISIDMLTQGGLVASRRSPASKEQVRARLQALRQLKTRYPELQIYAQSTLMRLAPTADGQNEKYKEKLAQWAELNKPITNQELKEKQSLENQIPLEVRNEYLDARNRSYSANRLVINLVKDKVIDYLVLGQDDAKPRGIHLDERRKLSGKVDSLGLAKFVHFQTGTDEIAMLLLARQMKKSPIRIQVLFSDDSDANKVMPFEDKPLKQTISEIVKTTAAVLVENRPDVLLFVYTSRHKTDASLFVKKISAAIKTGQKVAVADIDPIGDIQGGDSAFFFSLANAGLLSQLFGYASWNTAGNTLGTVVAQITMQLSAKSQTGFSNGFSRFTTHRYLDDFYYHSIIRPGLKRQLIGLNISPVYWESASVSVADSLVSSMFQAAVLQLNGFLLQQNADARLSIKKPRISFPWNRLFEAEINFD